MRRGCPILLRSVGSRKSGSSYRSYRPVSSLYREVRPGMVTSPVHHCCPEARSYLMKNDNHDITGVYLGRYHPTVLGVIFGLTAGGTTLAQEYAKAVRASRLGVHTVTDVSADTVRTLPSWVLGALAVVFGTVPT